MTVTDPSLAALLLTNRIVDVSVKPLSAGEFWSLCRVVQDPSVLVGRSASEVSDVWDVSLEQSQRVARLLGAGTAFSFERQRLAEHGILLVSALDDSFPTRLRERLGDLCPAFLLIAGPKEFLEFPAVGVVGSRDASENALAVAVSAAEVAATAGRSVASGLARGIDQVAMTSALDAGTQVVGYPSEGLRIAGRNAEIRSRVHAGELCMASPYGPSTRFTAGNAIGRNRLIYGHADVTLVVCADDGSGGTWEGAREAIHRGFGLVAVWMGEGAGPGNSKLVESGGVPITDLHDLLTVESVAPPPQQQSLFDST